MKKNIGSRVKALRTARKLTQAVLAERCGLTTEAVSNIERGVNYPSFETLNSFTRALECSLADLLDVPGGNGKTKRAEQEARLMAAVKSLPDDKMETALKLISVLL